MGVSKKDREFKLKGNKIVRLGGWEVALQEESGKKTMKELLAVETRIRRTGQPIKRQKGEKLILTVGIEPWNEENFFSYASHEPPANLRFTKYAVLRLSSQI